MEDRRYKAVQLQIKEFLDLAAHKQADSTPIAGFGYAWLAAEMFMKNEEGHAAHIEARRGLLAVLQERTARES